MKCIKCAHEYEGKFCPECGTPAETLCPKCNIPITGKFCAECGYSALQQEEPKRASGYDFKLRSDTPSGTPAQFKPITNNDFKLRQDPPYSSPITKSAPMYQQQINVQQPQKKHHIFLFIILGVVVIGLCYAGFLIFTDKIPINTATGTKTSSSISSSVDSSVSSSAGGYVSSSVNDSENISSKPTTSQSDSKGGIGVDKSLFNVDVTLPSSFFKMMGISVEDYDKKSDNPDGIVDMKVNADKSVTMTITKEKHKELLDEVKKSFSESLPNPETFASIKEMKYNNDLTKIQLFVDKAAYEKSLDSMAAIAVGINASMYQNLNGISDPNVSIEVIDQATNEVIKAEKYPK